MKSNACCNEMKSNIANCRMYLLTNRIRKKDEKKKKNGRHRCGNLILNIKEQLLESRRISKIVNTK